MNRRPLNPIPPASVLTDEFSASDFSGISADPFGNLDNPFVVTDESLQPRPARLRHLEILEEVKFKGINILRSNML